MSDFTEPPRRCPVCGGTVWRETFKFVTMPLPRSREFERVLVPTGRQVCTGCEQREREQRRARDPYPTGRELDLVSETDPDADGQNSIAGQLPPI